MENKKQNKNKEPISVKVGLKVTDTENIKEIDIEIMNLFAEMKLYSVKEEKPETFQNLEYKNYIV